MHRIAFATILFAVTSLSQPVMAQPTLDCTKSVQQAQQSVDKVSEDLKGMEKMPKDQLLQVHTLLDDAKMLLDGARHNCDHPRGDYDIARAIAKADAARGSAEAADVLHWHFMKGMSAMTGMGGTGAGAMHDMPGMKK
jgi:hypothetical protein